MKNVKIDVSCHFVHQNVTAVLADSKIQFGQQTFQNKLNEMTKFAAIAEHCESKYSSFNDVIKFDGSKDITYFPGLWKGDPPMAPRNEGYSERALQLKSTLMAFVQTKMKNDSTFDDFQLLTETLWNSVCRENYIFSFKNTQEAIAYNDLDAAFSQWSWILHRKLLEWRQQTGNAISNCPHNQVAAVVTTCLTKADSMLQETHRKLAEEMKDFFENNEWSDTLAQWRSRYETRLKHVKDDCKSEARKQCELMKHNREGHLKLENIQKHYRKQLLKQIQQLVVKAKQNKTTLTQQELENKFDEKWQLWIAEFPADEYPSIYTSGKEIECLIIDVLQELLAKYNSTVTNNITLSEKGKHDLHITVAPQHLNLDAKNVHLAASIEVVRKKVTAFFGFGKEEDDDDFKNAQKATDNFFKMASNSFCKVKRNFQNFDRSYAFCLLKEFIDEIESYNKRHEHMFTSEYIVDMALTLAGFLKVEFIKLMNDVRASNDPVVSFTRLRKTFLQTFLMHYKEISCDITAATYLCQLLSFAIQTAVTEILPAKVIDQMKISDPSFRQKKFYKVKVLTDLAKQKSFQHFQMYLTDIRGSFEYWAAYYVELFCMGNRKENLLKISRSIVHEIIVKIDASVKGLNRSMPIKKWLKIFHERISEILTIDLGEMQDIIGTTCIESSSENFVQNLSKQLVQEEEEIMKVIADPNFKLSDITKWTISPHILLRDSLIGCTEQCPFCGEQCELTDPNHVAGGKDHFINIHRPQCLGRWTWNISKKLVLDLCTFSVESENRFCNQDTNYAWIPYKYYRRLYKNWCISNESPTEAPKYWQWFISRYLKDIIQWAGAAPTSISHLRWKSVSQEMAVASLSEVYKITN